MGNIGIRQRAISWTTKFLSGAGKLILLKSVFSALPTYTMSCFKLPLSLCKQIQSLLTRFWWDLSPEIKKVCWVAWDRLTNPKSIGGLGFRDIEHFNDAMLTKIAWRLVKDLHSLLAQTLLGKYCRHSEFLEVSAPRSASHGWRGILAGKEVLKKGLGWLVGDGRNIRIWSDPWLSIKEPLIPMGPQPENSASLRVKDLLNPEANDWDIEAIRFHLPHYEESIRSIIPPSFPQQDILVWLPNKSGIYSTKSGYALSKLQGGGEAQSDFNWKTCIWQINTTPKIKHFLWKANARALPVGSALLRRGVNTDGKCKRCGEIETELHVLFTCPFAKEVWKLFPCTLQPSRTTTASISQLLQACRRMVAPPPPTGVGDTPMYPWLLWTLWTNRNKLVFEDKTFTMEETVLKIVQDTKAWRNALDAVPKQSNSLVQCGQLCSNSSSLLNVNLPGTEAWKLFSDAAWNGATGNCGLGWHLQEPRIA